MNQAEIRKHFESKLNAWAKSKAIPVAWENVSFDTVNKPSFIRCYLLPATTVQGTLCDIERKGLFHINLFSPINAGPQHAEGLVAELETLFASGTYGNLKIDSPPSVGQSVPDGGYYMVPVRVPYLV